MKQEQPTSGHQIRKIICKHEETVHIDFSTVQQKLTKSLIKLLKNDIYLLKHDLNEPTISHRIAMYLTSQFKKHDVDCEYNGNASDAKNRKKIAILQARAQKMGLIEPNSNEEMINRLVYPDIIVHKRGQSGSASNLLIIEVKKSSNSDEKAKDWDRIKLTVMTESSTINDFNYRFGASILIFVGEQKKCEVCWYRDGKEHQRSILKCYAKCNLESNI